MKKRTMNQIKRDMDADRCRTNGVDDRIRYERLQKKESEKLECRITHLSKDSTEGNAFEPKRLT